MKTLTLIRHAMSSEDFPLLGDFQRPLNPRGRRDVPVIAQRLAGTISDPVALVASPATRTLSTAQGFAEAFGLDDTDIHLEPAIYEATPGTLLALVNALPDEHRHVLMFGHNPGFTELGRLLSGDTLPCAELPPCACLSLAFEATDRWAEVTPGSGRVCGWLAP
jgi:phosphohistidine phosphatase